MSLAFYNSLWLALNISLGLIAAVAGWWMIVVRINIFRVLIGILWLIFLPNTIYMVTDIVHLPDQIPLVPLYVVPILTIQYLVLYILGIVTFILAVYPFELLIRHNFSEYKKTQTVLLILLCLLVSFAVVLGRIYRFHSWQLITQSRQVISAGFEILTSFHQIIFIILFGTISYLIYCMLKSTIITLTRKLLIKSGLTV